MANFVLLYSGGSAGTTPAEREKAMQAWGGWFGKLGDKIVDAGNPFAQHAKNVSNGAGHDGAAGNPPATASPTPKADPPTAAPEPPNAGPGPRSGGRTT